MSFCAESGLSSRPPRPRTPTPPTATLPHAHPGHRAPARPRPPPPRPRTPSPATATLPHAHPGHRRAPARLWHYGRKQMGLELQTHLGFSESRCFLPQFCGLSLRFTQAGFHAIHPTGKLPDIVLITGPLGESSFQLTEKTTVCTEKPHQSGSIPASAHSPCRRSTHRAGQRGLRVGCAASLNHPGP